MLRLQSVVGFYFLCVFVYYLILNHKFRYLEKEIC